MNCQDVTAILDELRPAELDLVLRRQAEVHVAGCAECARAWHAQASLALLPDMALPADFRMRCRAVVAAGLRPVASRRVGRGFLLGGSLVALAAAAAVVALLLRRTAPVSIPLVREADATGAVPQAAGAVSTEPAATGLMPAVAAAPAAAALFTVQLVPPQPPVIPPVDAAGDSSGPSAAQREEMRAYGSEPSRVQALQSLYSALLVELGKVPGLALVNAEPAEVTSASRHYRVRIILMTMAGADGRIVRDGRYVSVSMLAEEVQPGGKSISRAMEPSTIDQLAACTGTAQVADSPCHDARGTAAQFVDKLRQEVFPPDITMIRALQAKFRDSSLDPAQRFKLLAELYKLQSQGSDKSLLSDPDVVRAAIDLATSSTDPVRRARVWRSMRGTGSTALIEPLINSLLQDADDARLAAAEVLAADFSGDARVRAQLEAAAVGDKRPLLRAVAERGLSGEAAWRQYVTSSLKNTSLPAPQRVEALVYYLYPPGPDDASSPDNPDYFKIMKEVLADDAALRALAEALPRVGKLRDGNQGLLVSNIGYNFDAHPAITEMLLDYLDHDPQPRMRTIAGEVLARTRGSEPRVRDALVKALNSDPDAGVRDWIRQVMGDKAP